MANLISQVTPLGQNSDYGLRASAIQYGTSSVAAATAEKAVTCASFTSNYLTEGSIVAVKFSNTNSAAVGDLKLNVNSTGAKPIKYIYNGTLSNLPNANYLKANQIYMFYYDGTNWVVLLSYNTNDVSALTVTNSAATLEWNNAVTIGTVKGIELTSKLPAANPEFIVGTWAAASGTWTGVSKDKELFDGKQILLYMPFAGSGNATLNLTLADGSTTGAKNVYFESTSRFTTHKEQNSILHLVYKQALKLSNGTTYEGWWYIANRDTNDSAYYLRDIYSSIIAGTNTIYQYSLIMQKPDQKWESFTLAGGTGTSKTRNSSGFLMSNQILYYNSGNAVAADAKPATYTLYQQNALVDLRYSFNIATNSLTANKPVYLVGTVDSTDGLFYLDTTWWTQTLPASNDGKVYIYLGAAYDGYRLAFSSQHPMFKYENNAVRMYGGGSNLLSGSGITISNNKINHTNSVTAQTTQAVYPIKIDAQGHISAYGSAITSMTPTSHTHGNLTNDGKLGTTANYAVVTGTGGAITAKSLQVDSPAAEGTATAFITSVSQSSDGQITALKSTVPSASTSVSGIVKLSSATNSTSEALAATPKAVKSAYDLANSAIPKSVGTAAGDIIYFSAASTPAKLAVGTSGQVLKISNGVPTWADETDTHYAANLITASSSTAKANAASGTNSVYLNLVENGAVRNAHQIVGDGLTAVSSDANGKITITSTHPAYTAKTAAAVRVGVDSTGHVVIGAALGPSDVGASPAEHTHAASLAEDTGTSSITLAHGGKYKLTAGGNSVIFTMPAQYSHPSGTAKTAGAYKVGSDALGHVIIGNALQLSDLGGAPAEHSHGNIQSNGTLQTNDVAIANGDKLVITDSSDSNKVARTSITFDGSTATKALTQKGTWETFNNYSHPTYTAADAAAIKVGRDSTGHVVIGGALGVADIGAAPAEHSHGKITNAGAIASTNNVAIANGDRLIISDSSDSSILKNTSITFDGSTATKALTQKGTWETFNNYSLPIATNSVLGGVKPWYNHTAASTGPAAGSNATAVSVNSITSTGGRYYAAEADSNGRLFTNVPWTDTKVNVVLGTTTKAFLTGVSTTPTSSSQALTAIADTGVYLTTTAGQLNAKTYKVDEEVTLQYNTTTKSLDFIFA